MRTSSETLTFWRNYAQVHQSHPLLTRTLPAWTTLFPGDSPETTGTIQNASSVAWEDFDPINEWDETETAQQAQALENRIAEVLNRVAFDRLLQITTTNGQAVDLDLATLISQIESTSDPLDQMALFAGPVAIQTQIAWLAAWWIQDTHPAGIPTPAWVTAPSSLNWPDPAWEPRTAPRPRWLIQWLRTWAAENMTPAKP